MKAMKAKKILQFVLTLAMVVIFAGTSFAEKKKVAVMGFDDGTLDHWWGDTWKVGDGIADMFVTSLVKMGRFSVIERQQLEKVMKEQSLGLSGMIDPKQAKEVGKLAGVDYLITGKVTVFETHKKEMKAGKLFGDALGGMQVDTTEGNCQVDARMIDVKTGEIVSADMGKGQSSKSGVSFNQGDLQGMEFGGSDFESNVLGAATRKSVDDLAAKFGAAVGLVGSVASIEANGSVYIDLLKSDGIKNGMKFTVKRKTGTMMIKGEEKAKWSDVGEIEVTEAGDEYSVAKTKSGGPFQVGDQVKAKEGK